ncbi:hypothetical protein FHS42_002786 [Streptomyces zagrosensis]|uniref:2-oxoacid:ferredoxin oxidoreductase subunit beta n=1 Tax=Streptomyces zagrosensis TaxID=1042984 RepID=A0A7W9UYI8_9ACTN|nr:hypothetical protein [Streptomyces zagrosensis]
MPHTTPPPTSAAAGAHSNAGVKDRLPSLALVPRADSKQAMKDFKSDQEVRWCPGCGDYAVLAAVQGFPWL